MKKQSNKNRRFLNFIYVLLILLLLSWILFWGNNSFYKKWKLKRKINRMEQQYNTLKAQNDSLANYNYRLKTDPEAAEEVAREEHGLIKSDETVFIFKEATNDSLKQDQQSGKKSSKFPEIKSIIKK